MSESATRADEIAKCEEESVVKKDFEKQKENENCIQNVQNNSNFNPNLCTQYVLYDENEKLKIVEETKQPLDNITESSNDNTRSSPSNQSSDILGEEASSPSLSSNEKGELGDAADIPTKNVFIEIPVDEKASQHEKDEEKEVAEDNDNPNDKQKVTKCEKIIWKISQWMLIVVIAILMITALSGFIYFFCKGKKAYVPPDDSRKAYMKAHNMTEEDYEIEIRNNRTLARAKYPWNPYLWLPDTSSWG